MPYWQALGEKSVQRASTSGRRCPGKHRLSSGLSACGGLSSGALQHYRTPEIKIV